MYVRLVATNVESFIREARLMEFAGFRAQESVEVGQTDSEILELLSRLRGALRDLGIQGKPVPVLVPVRARYTYPLRPGRRSRR